MTQVIITSQVIIKNIRRQSRAVLHQKYDAPEEQTSLALWLVCLLSALAAAGQEGLFQELTKGDPTESWPPHTFPHGLLGNGHCKSNGEDAMEEGKTASKCSCIHITMEVNFQEEMSSHYQGQNDGPNGDKSERQPKQPRSWEATAFFITTVTDKLIRCCMSH